MSPGEPSRATQLSPAQAANSQNQRPVNNYCFKSLSLWGITWRGSNTGTNSAHYRNLVIPKACKPSIIAWMGKKRDLLLGLALTLSPPWYATHTDLQSPQPRVFPKHPAPPAPYMRSMAQSESLGSREPGGEWEPALKEFPERCPLPSACRLSLGL